MSMQGTWLWDDTNKKWVKAAGTSEGHMSIHCALDYLNDVGDVSVADPTNNFFVYWDNAASLWKCKSISALAVAAVEAAGLTLAAAKNIILANDGVIQLGVLDGSPELFGGEAGSPYEAFIRPKDGNRLGELGIMPSGTETESALVLWNTSDYDNGGFIMLWCDDEVVKFYVGKHGTGTAPTALGLYIPLSMVSNKITDLALCTEANDAARKAYVDDEITSAAPAGVKTATITFIIDGGGAVITTGEKGHLEIPFACTIEAWTLLADQDGAIKIDVWRDTYALYPPTNDDSLCGGHEPEIVATAKKAQDLDLSDWASEELVAGDVLAFNVDSIATIQRVTLSLKVTKT